MAGRRIGAVIALDGEKEFKSAVTGVNGELKNLKSQLEVTKERFAGQANSLEALRAKHDVLSRTLDTQRQKLEATRTGLDHAKQSYANMATGLERLKSQYEAAKTKMDAMRQSSTTTEDELRQQEAEVRRLGTAVQKSEENYQRAANRVTTWETSLNSAEAQTIRADRELQRNAGYMREAERSTDRCTHSIDEFGRETRDAGDETNRMGRNSSQAIEELASVLATAGIAKGVQEITKALWECTEAANEFETIVAKVGTVMDTSKVSNEGMKEAIMNLSNETGKGVVLLGESTYQAISASVDTAKAVETVGKASKLATGGFTDEATAIDILTTATNAYGKKASSVQKISDLLITTQNLGKTSVGNLASTMGQVIPLAAGYAVSLEDLSTTYAVLTANGIKTDQATTYIKSSLSELGDSGSKVSAVLKEQTGKSFVELMESGTSLGDVIQAIGESVGGNSVAFNNLWSSSEAGVGMLSLLNSGSAKYNSVLGQMQNSAGATDKAFKIMSNTTGFAQEKMKNSVKNLQIAIGEQLNPSLKELYKVGGNAFDWANDFVMENPWIVDAVTGLTAAMGVLVVGVTGLLVAEKVIAVMKKLGAIMLANPYVLVAAAIAGVVVALGTFAARAKEAKKENFEFTESIESLASGTESLNEKVSENKTAFDESKASIETQYGALQIMSDKLYDLAGKESLSNEQKTEMKSLVDQLNASIPNLNLSIDEQSSSLSKAQEATEGYIQSLKDKALYEAVEKRMNGVIEEQAEAQANVKIAMTQREKAQEKLNKVTEEQNKLVKESNDSFLGVNENELYKLSEQTYEYQEAINSFDKTIEENGKIVTESDTKYESLTSTLDSCKKGMDAANQAAAEASAAEQQQAEAAQAAIVSADAQKAALESLRSKYEEIKSSIQQSIENKINLFDAFYGGADLTVEQMMSNLDSQLEGLRNWKTNMEKLSQEVGTTIGPEFYNYLIEMGPEAANAVQHMVSTIENEGDSGKEKLKKLANDYAESLDFSEDASTKLANTKAAIDMALGKMTNSDSADFSNLTDSFNEAVEEFKGGANEISSDVAAAFQAAVEAAQQSGAEIPDGLAAGILSGEITVQDAIAQLNGATQAQFEFLSGLAQDAGITIPDNIKTGIAAGGADAVAAMQQLGELFKGAGVQIEQESGKAGENSSKNLATGSTSQAGTVKTAADTVTKGALDAINNHQMGFSQAGTTLIQGLAGGIGAGAYLARSKAGSAASDANNSASMYYNSFYNTGYNLAQGLANGFTANSPAVSAVAANAVRNAVQAAKNAGGVKSPSRVFRDQVGIQLSKGLELGILDGKKGVMNSSIEIARAAINASKTELDVHSPSGVFIKIGKNLGDGLEIGIKGKSKSAVRASKKMAKDVYAGASSWLSSYKKTHSTTLQQEEDFWKKVSKTVNKGTKEYADAMKKVSDINSFQNEMQNKVKNFGVSWQKDDKKKTTKTDKEYYNELYKAAKTYFDNYKSEHKVSLQEEKYYWEQVKSQMKAGTQGYYDAQKKIKAASDATTKQINENKKKVAEKERQDRAEKLSNSDSLLTNYKTYRNVSAKAEMQYWDIVRKQFKAGTNERLEADQKYFEAKESLTEDLKELENDYYDKQRDINEKLKDDVKNLTDAYNDAVKDRADSIYSSFGLFDEFESESESGAKLLYNLKTQVAGIADWELQLDELGKKGLSKELMDELKAMGPEASASIHALNTLSAEQLAEYDKLWKDKKDLSQNQAVKDMEPMRQETMSEIQKLQQDAQKELNIIKKEYDDATKQLTKSISSELTKFAKNTKKLGEDAVANLLKGITGGVSSKSAKIAVKSVSSTITKDLGKLPTECKTIGNNALQGILDGLTNKKKIDKSAKEFIDSLKKAIQEAADIHSPSRLFKKEIGVQIPAGIGEGITEGTKKATQASSDMMKKLMEDTKEKTRQQNKALADYSQNLTTGSQMNDMFSIPNSIQQQTGSRTQLSERMDKMLNMMEMFFPQFANSQIVLDTGELVSATQPLMGHAFAMSKRRVR